MPPPADVMSRVSTNSVKFMARSSRSRLFPQPLDRTAVLLIVILSAIISLVLLKGDRTSAHIRDFSWYGKQVGMEDRAFVLTFSRPMDHRSVESNLRIDPPLNGKISWAGRRMAYTLNDPPPYGYDFELRLQNARDRFSSPDDPRTQMQPYLGRFRSRDRAFAYIGIEGDTAGRLVLYNLTTEQKRVLTPEDLVVVDFKPYPQGDRILFSANNRTAENENLLDQQLYTVTTGLQIEAPAAIPGQAQPKVAPARPPGEIEQILDSRDYQNMQFDLSADGEKVVVQRINRNNPAEFGLWLIEAGKTPQPLKGEPGGDFLIARDSKSLAINQGQGVAIMPLESGAEPLDFLAQFGQTLSFSPDGLTAAMVKFNENPQNPTRSLFLVAEGTTRELLNTNGLIRAVQFHPTRPLLYCLFTTLLSSGDNREQPYLAAIDTKTGKRVDLLMLPMQQDIQISLSPDGLGVLFDQIQPATEAQESPIYGSDGQPIANSSLWFLPLVSTEGSLPRQTEPQPLPLTGLRPRWLP